MADDILLTPEEQDEKAKQWLKDNGPALFMGVILGLGAIFGFNHYKDKKQADAEAASMLYNTITQQVSDSSIADIGDAVSQLKTNYPSSAYAAKAVLIHAAKLSKTDTTAAMAEYQWVNENAQESGVLHSARIRQAKLHVAQGDLDAAIGLASQQPYDKFASHYYEILGDIAVKQGKLEAARDYYQQASDQLLPSDAAYASVLTLKIAPLPKKDVEVKKDAEEDAEKETEQQEAQQK